MSVARFGFENDSLYTFQNNYFYTIGIITFGLTLINSSIIYLIGTHYLTLIKNKYEKYVYAFVLIHVSFILGFLSVFIIPTCGLTYFLSNLLNVRLIKKMENLEVIGEIIKHDENKNEDISEEKNEDINEDINEDTSDEEIITNDDIKNEETSEEENGQNCRGCGCFLVDGTECVQPNSSKAYCNGCFEGLEIPDENNKKEEDNKEEVENKEEENKVCSNECIEECSKECNEQCNEECNKNKRIFNFINSIKEDSIIGTIFKNEIYQNKILNNHLQS
jgi:hypothetical protein